MILSYLIFLASLHSNLATLAFVIFPLGILDSASMSELSNAVAGVT